MKKLLAFAFLAVALAVLAFTIVRHTTPAERVIVKLTPGPNPPEVSPGEAGIDPLAIEQAIEYAGAHGTRALLIVRGNHLVVQKYWGDINLDTPVEISGFTPALAALALGTAINDRLLTGIDTPVSTYLPDVAPEQGARTLQQLMSTPAEDAAFPADVAMLARVLEKLTNQGYETLISERLWHPLEAGEFSLTRNGPKAPVRADCCMTARLGDWLRLGALLANDGVFEGNQFTPPRYVTQMITPIHKASPVGFFTRVDGIFAAHDTARLESSGMQRLWAVPSLQLVILRYGDDPGKEWDEAMIPDTIVRGTSGWQSSAVSEGIDPKKFAPH